MLDISSSENYQEVLSMEPAKKSIHFRRFLAARSSLSHKSSENLNHRKTCYSKEGKTETNKLEDSCEGDFLNQGASSIVCDSDDSSSEDYQNRFDLPNDQREEILSGYSGPSLIQSYDDDSYPEKNKEDSKSTQESGNSFCIFPKTSPRETRAQKVKCGEYKTLREVNHSPENSLREANSLSIRKPGPFRWNSISLCQIKPLGDL